MAAECWLLAAIACRMCDRSESGVNSGAPAHAAPDRVTGCYRSLMCVPVYPGMPPLEHNCRYHCTDSAWLQPWAYGDETLAPCTRGTAPSASPMDVVSEDDGVPQRHRPVRCGEGRRCGKPRVGNHSSDCVSKFSSCCFCSLREKVAKSGLTPHRSVR
eukprot:COSAG01_NODE_26457_length_713_cov_1.825733_1_plen_158_part_00